jgi:8-oxo-dGTP diphosphatase
VEPTTPVLAAGAVVWREVAGRLQVLLVHRPRGDWTFPKGKADPGERLPATAQREIAEETGLEIRLGVPLTTMEYLLPTGATKRVSYWSARPCGNGELDFAVNDEIDDLRWADADEAPAVLSYDHYRQVLACFTDGVPGRRHTTVPLVVLRHAKALPRRSWKRNDRRRPLADLGEGQAQRLVPLLQAYGVDTVVTSDSTRCVQTVEPYAEAAGLDLVRDRALSQEDATRKRVAKRVSELLGGETPTLVCTHRPVLPLVFDELGLDCPRLDPAELVVLHRRGSTVVATERHIP